MQPEFEEILKSDLTDVEKLAQAYVFILRQQQTFAQNEIELQSAIGDKQALLKEQIKKGVLKYSGEIFAFCYYRVTGKKLQDD
jgi:hypothetical protein